MGVLSDDGLEDVREFRVFSEGVWRWWDSSGGAESNFGSGRVGWEEGEDVTAEGFLVREDVLSVVSRSIGTRRKGAYDVWVAF